MPVEPHEKDEAGETITLRKLLKKRLEVSFKRDHKKSLTKGSCGKYPEFLLSTNAR